MRQFRKDRGSARLSQKLRLKPQKTHQEVMQTTRATIQKAMFQLSQVTGTTRHLALETSL
jgi:hypothetical protein